MDGWGDYYNEFWVGFGSEVPTFVSVTCRNDTNTIFFHGRLGLITVQKIETLEFDGWEVFDSIEQKLTRFERTKDARKAVLQAYFERLEEIVERGDDPKVTGY